MKKQTKAIIIAVSVVLVLALAAFLMWNLFSPETQEGDKTISIEVTHADGTMKDFTLNTDAEYLWAAMEEDKLVEGYDTEYGKWITAVDGETADEANNQYWVYTKGGEWVEYSADACPIADGEKYEFYIYAS